MSELVANCPRCGSCKITFDVTAAQNITKDFEPRHRYETFCICRNCRRTTIFILSESADLGSLNDIYREGFINSKRVLNNYVTVDGYVGLKDQSTVALPEYIPEDIEAIFKEGATCLAVNCYNAAGTMFRLCVDLATRAKLPEGDTEGLSAKVRRDLGLRLPWLFTNGLLPATLKELSSCIKEDGNDGAHAGTLEQPDAEDLMDFTKALLDRMYTEPERLRLAQERRDSRRGKEK